MVVPTPCVCCSVFRSRAGNSWLTCAVTRVLLTACCPPPQVVTPGETACFACVPPLVVASGGQQGGRAGQPGSPQDVQAGRRSLLRTNPPCLSLPCCEVHPHGWRQAITAGHRRSPHCRARCFPPVIPAPPAASACRHRRAHAEARGRVRRLAAHHHGHRGGPAGAELAQVPAGLWPGAHPACKRVGTRASAVGFLEGQQLAKHVRLRPSIAACIPYSPAPQHAALGLLLSNCFLAPVPLPFALFESHLPACVPVRLGAPRPAPPPPPCGSPA